ncbi:MAG: hypothetical protein APR56_12110 [Methanosaeta sp. SDB]|nr:MAG: hypothetical protein APR56_12110 [Methanosaeta sp. SDB]
MLARVDLVLVPPQFPEGMAQSRPCRRIPGIGGYGALEPADRLLVLATTGETDPFPRVGFRWSFTGEIEGGRTHIMSLSER